jgi:two-component system phosphate regulon sensor histidine kinase PhoR
MILAMGSLVALQWYWIRNAITVKKEQFERNVKTALMETVRKIEQEEVLYVAHQRLANQEQNKLFAVPTNKINDEALRKKILEHDIVLNSIYNETFFREFNKKVENLGEKVPGNKEKVSEYINEKLKQENENLKKFIKNNDDLEKKFTEINEMNRWMDSTGLYNKSHTLFSSKEVYSSGINLDLVKGIIHDLMLGERSIAERMGTVMLDTLLRNELNNMGIQVPFQYAVEDKGLIVLASPSKKINNDSYKIRLFPADSFQNNQFLHVSFPQKDNYIFKNLLWVFAISTLLILLVGGIFYYSANSLISERRLAKVKNDFINNMTHELKTPVSSISLALEVIQDKEVVKTEEKTSRYLSIIKEENQRLALQIEKVLQMAKLEENQIRLVFESVNINEVIREVLKNMEVHLEHKLLQLNLYLEAKDAIVTADKVHLTNVFYNLLDNALKYSKDHLTLEIRTSNPTKNEVTIQIIDDGIGVDSTEIDRVFEKFYRVPTGDLHDVKGFGLGLSYVKNMVRLHKGTVQLKSKLNGGSTFTITLPIEKS